MSEIKISDLYNYIKSKFEEIEENCKYLKIVEDTFEGGWDRDCYHPETPKHLRSYGCDKCPIKIKKEIIDAM